MSPSERQWQDESTVGGRVRPAARRLRLDHTHGHHQRRIARAVADRLPLILAIEEQVLAFTEGVELCGPVARAVQGVGWLLSRRVALLFTDRRLIEIGLSASGRRTLGGIRAFPWDLLPGVQITRGSLELRTWSESSFRWALRDEVETAVQTKLRDRVDLSVSTYRPSEIRSVPVHLCSRCAAPLPGAMGDCSRCGLVARSPSLAAALAVAAPGAGHLYVNRPAAAAVRCLVELAAFGAVARSLLGAIDLREAATVATLGALVVGMLKLHGAVLARMLARRADMIAAPTRRRWRWLVPVGGIASVAVASLPLLFVGSLDRRISWDLDFLIATSGWRGERVSTLADDPEARSHWIHRDGWEARVSARPLEPFETPAAAWTRLTSELGFGAEPLLLGPHQVARETSTIATPTGDRLVRLRLAVVDEEGRDLHVVSTEVAPERASDAAERLEELVGRGVWVSSSAPLGQR